MTAPAAALGADASARTSLLSNVDGEAYVVDARDAAGRGDVLVFESFGHDLDFALILVGVIAFGLGALVTAIIASGAAPKTLYVLPAVWTVIGGFAFRAARRHRRRYGRFELDPGRAELRHAWHTGPVRTLALTEIARIHVEQLAHRDAETQRGARVEEVSPRWMELELRDGARLRIARARPWELTRVRAKLNEMGIAS